MRTGIARSCPALIRRCARRSFIRASMGRSHSFPRNGGRLTSFQETLERSLAQHAILRLPFVDRWSGNPVRPGLFGGLAPCSAPFRTALAAIGGFSARRFQRQNDSADTVFPAPRASEATSNVLDWESRVMAGEVRCFPLAWFGLLAALPLRYSPNPGWWISWNSGRKYRTARARRRVGRGSRIAELWANLPHRQPVDHIWRNCKFPSAA